MPLHAPLAHDSERDRERSGARQQARHYDLQAH
jgi:hypothetical protein